MDVVQQNGVSFTPEKVVDLDAYAKSGSNEQADGGSVTETKQEDTPVDQVSSDQAQEQEVSTPESGKTDVVETSAKSDGDEIPLNELYIGIGDEEVSASDLVDRYNDAKSQLDAIKNDEFLSRFVDYYKSGGKPDEFIKKASVDYGKISDVELVRMQFDNDNSDLDEEARNIIFERELVSKYGINPDGTYDDEDSKEAKVGKQLLKRDAQKLRSTFAEEQKKFLLPQANDTQKQQYDPNAVREELLRDKELESLVKNKSLPVGDDFSYETDPDKVIGMMTNTGEFWKLFQKQDGSWDKKAIAKVFAFALDPKKYDDHILKLGQDIGSESYIKEQKNTTERGKTRVVDKSTDASAPYVRGGKIMGNSEDLLKAFISQKR